jgi:hypothetical protein
MALPILDASMKSSRAPVLELDLAKRICNFLLAS